MKASDTIEKEIKVLGIDKRILSERIVSIGASKVLDALTSMEWYDCADTYRGVDVCTDDYENGAVVINEAVTLYNRSRVSFRESGIFFRLRKEGVSYDFTLKYKLSDSQGITHNREISVTLKESDTDRVRNSLKKAGFICIARHQKKRTSYVLEQENGKIRFDIDQWPGIPTYLEIEAENQSGILHALDQLGLQDYECSTEVGEEFFKKYGVDFYSDLQFS